MIAVSAPHSSKADSPTVTAPLPVSTLTSAEQFLNAVLSILVTLSGIVRDSILLHSANALSSIAVSFPPKVTVLRYLQYLNANFGTEVSEAGKTISVKFLHA
ncbi:unknown [Acidiphilium sp. CAG:727]|nr:unknown [Acidiphilium sp. CAG:727]